MSVSSFSDIAEEFTKRVDRIVWCTVATVDEKGRPMSCLLHPIWEGSTGWILTFRESAKAQRIDANPYVSLSYWDQEHQQVYAECKAQFIDDADEKARLWDLFKNTPEPMGYDPALFFENVSSPAFGALKLTPWRVELFALSDLVEGKGAQTWIP